MKSAPGTRPHSDFIRRAVEHANLNALRLALLQATGDPAFAAMRVEPAELNGGSSWATVLATDDCTAMIDRATTYLCGPLPAPAAPDTAIL